jgi:hypothetical protein
VLCSQQSLKLLEIEPDLLHNMPSYLVAETLRGNDCNLIADSLVGLEIEGQLGVVSLNDDLGGLFDGLGTNAAHNCGCEGLSKLKLSMSSGISEKSGGGVGETRLDFTVPLLVPKCLNHVTVANFKWIPRHY